MFSLPDMSYLGVMLAGFTTSMLVLSYGFVNLSEQEFINTLLETPTYIFLCFSIFYILQKRELKSFLKERTALIK